MLKIVKMFTDGSCLGNPGAGGYSAILYYKKNKKILTSGFHLTTNNRMELMAVILGLEHLNQSCIVEITTDSLYVQRGVINWMPVWKKKNGKPLKKNL